MVKYKFHVAILSLDRRVSNEYKHSQGKGGGVLKSHIIINISFTPTMSSQKKGAQKTLRISWSLGVIIESGCNKSSSLPWRPPWRRLTAPLPIVTGHPSFKYEARPILIYHIWSFPTCIYLCFPYVLHSKVNQITRRWLPKRIIVTINVIICFEVFEMQRQTILWR